MFQEVEHRADVCVVGAGGANMRESGIIEEIEFENIYRIHTRTTPIGARLSTT